MTNVKLSNIENNFFILVVEKIVSVLYLETIIIFVSKKLLILPNFVVVWSKQLIIN